MVKKMYAVLLNANTPPELFTLLTPARVQQLEGMTYILCSDVQDTGYYLLAHVLKADSAWPIRIPHGYVIAIADMSEPLVRPGFL